jgi:hypothetical protein
MVKMVAAGISATELSTRETHCWWCGKRLKKTQTQWRVVYDPEKYAEKQEVETMNRLDTLKARVAAAQNPIGTDHWATGADLDFIDHARSDIERLVAVVEAVENPEEDLTWGQMERMRKARAYWLEEEK